MIDRTVHFEEFAQVMMSLTVERIRSNYRPISLLSSLSKIFEHLLFICNETLKFKLSLDFGINIYSWIY